MQKFSDFSEEPKIFSGDRIPITSILNKYIEILDYRIEKSKINEGDFLIMQVKLDGQNCVVITGSNVLKRQIKKYESHLPFGATIVRFKNYYTFS